MKSNDNLKLITLYISLWGWQILAVIFLVSTFLMVAIPRNVINLVFTIAFIIIFVFCEYKSLKRKEDFYDELRELS